MGDASEQRPQRTWWNVLGGAFKFLGKFTLVWIAVIVGLGIIFGGSGGHQKKASPASAVAVSTTAPDPTNQNLAAAQQAVTEYYAAIDDLSYGQAWSYLGSEQRTADQGFQTWKAGYVNNMRTNLRSATPSTIDADTVAVAVRINTLDIDACSKDVRQTFEGTWTVDLAGQPVLSDANIAKVGGSDPVTSVANCPTSPAAPPATSQAYAYPPDTGSSSSSDSSFCSTHDCIGDFNNEPGTIVECADGTYSHAGGIQGACSSHGGEL